MGIYPPPKLGLRCREPKFYGLFSSKRVAGARTQQVQVIERNQAEEPVIDVKALIG
jgi:hypothetical protein